MTNSGHTLKVYLRFCRITAHLFACCFGKHTGNKVGPGVFRTQFAANSHGHRRFHYGCAGPAGRLHCLPCQSRVGEAASGKAIAVASFDDLILQDSPKEEIQSDLVNFFESRELYERYRIPWKRGALFMGPPGNGKTHTLKALINQIRRPCLYVKGFKSEYNADEENLRTIFQKARSVAPCLVIFEDLDTMVGDGSRTVF